MFPSSKGKELILNNSTIDIPKINSKKVRNLLSTIATKSKIDHAFQNTVIDNHFAHTFRAIKDPITLARSEGAHRMLASLGYNGTIFKSEDVKGMLGTPEGTAHLKTLIGRLSNTPGMHGTERPSYKGM